MGFSLVNRNLFITYIECLVPVGTVKAVARLLSANLNLLDNHLVFCKYREQCHFFRIYPMIDTIQFRKYSYKKSKILKILIKVGESFPLCIKYVICGTLADNFNLNLMTGQI